MTAAVNARHTRTRSIRSMLATALKYGSLVGAALVTLLPLVVIFGASLKRSEELQTTSPLSLPRELLNFSNYTTAFRDGAMLGAFANTALILAVSTVGTVAIGSMTAFAISRFEFRLKRVVLGLFLFATLVPPVTTQVATFQVINQLGLFNSRWSAIVLFTGTDIVSIYIFLQHLRTIPVALDEAAILDGASYLTVFRRIVFPLMKPAIATVVILKSVAIYNEFYIPFLYMPDRSLGVISTSLFRFKGPYGTRWEVIAAGIVISVVPTLSLFLALQRFIYNGFTSGASK